MKFDWDKIQYKEDGKVLLLYRHERIFKEGLIKSGDRVLDIGGWGHFTERCYQEDAICTVLDNLSPDQYYPYRVTETSFIKEDICNLQWLAAVGQYDVVTCQEVLEHVSNIENAISNIYKFLKPKGYFIGTVPIPGFCHHIGEPGITFINKLELKNLLTSVGFIDIVIEPTGSTSIDEEPSSLYFYGVKNG